MVIYQFQTFLHRSDAKDPYTGEYIYPDIHAAAEEMGITKGYKPKIGTGSHLGGYVCVCDFCGTAFYTYNNLRRFCNHECKTSFFNTRKVKEFRFRENKVPYGTVTRICACCEHPFEVHHAIIDDGRAVFCGRACFHKFRFLKAMWFKCNYCGTKFKAIHSKQALFCCEECKKEAPTHDRERVYIEYTPIPCDDHFDKYYYDRMLNVADKVMVAYRLYVRDNFGKNLPSSQYPRLTREIVEPIMKKN